MNGYKAFYRGRSIEVHAETSYKAQIAAAMKFKARHTHEVAVVLCERADGSVVAHTCAEFG